MPPDADLTAAPRAAIITVGTELTRGLRVDTNTSEIAHEVTVRGFSVRECVSIGDDAGHLAETIRRLLEENDLVITTGGLGPTHDDITREAASVAIGRPLVRDTRLEGLLGDIARRHSDPEAFGRTFRQADVLDGARIIDFTTGTAPGQCVDVDRALLVLLPGPPSEMRPMLREALRPFTSRHSHTRTLGVVGLTESDAQVRVSRVVDGTGIEFTVLARPGDVQVILTDDGRGAASLDEVTARAAETLGDRCYSTKGEALPAVVLAGLRREKLTLALAESCTGGLIAASLTDIAGSSDVLLGSAVTYSDASKTALLGVPRSDLAAHGAVSEVVALAMAAGARSAFGSDLAVAVTGIAGPGGGTPDKPVGTVWFAVARPGAAPYATVRHFAAGSREAVRARAAATALDLVRTETPAP